MIEIRTLLRYEEGSFVYLEDCTIPPQDPDYVEGAIEFYVDGAEIIGVREWDYVDQLWSYIADMVKDLIESGMASTYFPDQPIELSFKRNGSRVLVSCALKGETRRAEVELDELMEVIRKAGIAFFEKMSTLFPENSSSYGMASRDLLINLK